MAIALGNYVENTAGSGTSISLTLDAGSSGSRFVYVLTRSDRDPTTATYSGASMTKLASGDDGTGNFAGLFYITAAASGSNTLTVNFGSSAGYIQAFATALSGVDSVEASNSSIGVTVGTTASISVTTATANAWVVGAAEEQGAGVTSAGSGTVIIGTGNNAARLYQRSDNPQVTPGSQTMNFSSTSGSSDWSTFAMAVKPAAGATVNTLVVAGGGGGGRLGGGGGGGGYQADTGFVVTPQAYTITVGAGGAGSTSRNSKGTNGDNSVFGTITATGGGGGGSGNTVTGSNGGSGGGASSSGSGTTAGGTGSQGNNGGSADANFDNGAGGGGASAVGQSTTTGVGGNGGAGTANSISGASVTYAGGGGGGATTTAGTGGSGGGGAGATGTSNGTAGTANTGGGGGGSRDSGGGGGNGGAGGSGIVIISYPTDGSTGVSTSSTGGTITTSGANTIHTFTSSGTWTMVAAGGAVAGNAMFMGSNF